MGGVPTEHSGQTPRQRLKQERKLAALHEVFSFFDTDNDGVLDAAGLEEMLRKRLGPDIPAASLKDLLQQLNPSGASALHFEEFAHGLNQCAGASSADPASARSSPQPGAHRALKARCAELEEELEFSKATILHLLEELRVINASPTDSDSELEGTGGSFTTSKVLTGTAKLVQPGATTTRAAEGLPANTGISEAQQLRVKDRLICELRAQNKQLLDELAGAQKENDKLRAAGRRDMRLQEQHSQLLDKVRGLRHQNEALGAEKAELQRQLDGLKKQVRQHRNQQTMAKEKVNICAQRLQEKGEMLERVHATLKALHTQFAATMQGVSAATVHAHSTAGAAAYKLASVAAAEATLQGLQPEVNTLESQCNMLMQKLALETKARKANCRT
ncbi:hypothetical protein WJX72_007109 [[Myrmecia] bisecta]|uniref:EF-hand domain-containing protein n=1 Tax=[Myrmecia] bisecta TaxID=41462 RepID=A0AAW1PW64_9CHLO